MKKIIVDLDGTLTVESDLAYQDKKPNQALIDQLRKYAADGFAITVHTARNMRTYEGNLGKINKHTLPDVIEWLEKHKVPYDEVLVGKPWCGTQGFYIDDRAVRPDEFVSMSYEELTKLFGRSEQ